MSGDPYVYPGTRVLINKFGITDQTMLDFAERRLVSNRMRSPVPVGDFDLAHLQAIHRHLFQDIYDWAGQIRTVTTHKLDMTFMPPRYIAGGFANVHRRLVAADYLKGLSAQDFAIAVGSIIGDTNYVHPFREGNTRAQIQYLRQLAETAGHRFRIEKISIAGWRRAARAAYFGRYDALGRVIAPAVIPIVRQAK